MTRAEFIERVTEYGIALLDARAKDPGRIDFIKRLGALGEALLETQGQDLRNFVKQFVEHPDRFRWELLGRTALDRKDLAPMQIRQLDVLGLEPDLLAPLHRLRKELSHTRALSWALAPTHRWLGHAPLEAFLQRIDHLWSELSDDGDTPHLWHRDELASARVQAEHHLSGFGRADISITLPRALILVEVKIDAEVRPGQIEDYYDAATAFVEGSNKVPVVVLLTSDPEAGPSRPIPHLTFEQLLRDWLPVAAAMDTPEHRYFSAYLASIARVVGVGAAGSFDDWGFVDRRRAIDFIKTKDFE